MHFNIKNHNLFKRFEYEKKLKVSPVMAQVLMNRNISVEEADGILNDPLSLIENPTDIYGAQRAAEAIAKAIIDHKKIYVFADYDVDGITSGTLLKRFISRASNGCLPPLCIHYPERADSLKSSPYQTKKICS